MAIDFQAIKEQAETIMSLHSDRDTMFDSMDALWQMKGDNLPSGSYIKQTISPNAHNALAGVKHLLEAAEPVWSVPYDTTDQEAQQVSDKIERLSVAWLKASDGTRGKRLTGALSLYSLLYGQADVAVTLVDDLIAATKDPISKARLEQIKQHTPVLLDAYNSRACYPLYDQYGMSAHLVNRKVRVSDIKARWGDVAQVAGKKLSDTVTLYDYWDNSVHCVWIEEGGDPLLPPTEHKLGFIPVASAIVSGDDSYIDSGEVQNVPFLYAVDKSKIAERENLILTAISSTVFSVASNPQLAVFLKPERQGQFTPDYSVPGGVWQFEQGEDLKPISKLAIDPGMRELWAMMSQLGEESTIFKQVLGQSLGANAPYSMVAMLSQAGRHRLVPYQRNLSFVLGMAMTIAWRLLKVSGGEVGALVAGKGQNRERTTIKADEIPDDLMVECKLDVQMPQDEAQNVRMAAEATSPRPDGTQLMSMRAARENYLHIGQSDDMEKEIWSEKAAMLKIQQAFQQMMQPQAPQGMPPQGGMPQQGMPPQMPGGAQPGLPMTEPQMPAGMPPGLGATDAQVMGGMGNAPELA